MAVPSAKNSGLDKMSNLQPGLALASRMVLMDLFEHARTKTAKWSIFEISRCSATRLLDSLGGPAGDGRLLDDDLGAGRNFGDPSGGQLDVVQVGGETGTETGLFGGGVDRDKDQVGLGDTLVDLGGEEQVPAPASLDDIDETGLVDGQVEVGVVPGVDTGLVDVDDGDLDVRTLEGAIDVIGVSRRVHS